MKKIYIAMLLAAFALNGAMAQDKQTLNKEITLEKDIAPLEKKAVKKNELPKVKTPTVTGQKTQLGYSDLTSPIDVPTTIPTLLPYGYRTAHNFSDKRGYLDIGAGTQANFRLDFGYRLIDEEREKLGVWLNHNSTWNGKNSSKYVTLDENRNKQKFNDNTLGVDYSKALGNGTLTLGAKAHIDIYNLYGGWNSYFSAYELYSDEYGPVEHALVKSPYNWETEKQTFTDFNFNAGWKSHFMLRDNPLKYNVGLQYGHAAYDKSFNDLYKHGAHDNWGIITLGGSYDFNELSTAALGIKGEYLSRGAKAKTGSADDLFDEVGMITFSPTYTIRGDMYKLQLGVNGHLSFSDGAVFRLTPNVRFNLALVDGFTVFANALGGKNLGYRVPTHYYNHRYDMPLLMYGSIYTPLDAELGFKVGPFQGLSAKASVGYAMVKAQPGICYWTDYPTHALMGMMSTYMVMDARGYYVNAELAYKYRSLIEATASLKYAPHDDQLYESDKHYNNYKLGVDRASTVANIDLKVTPWRPLTLNAGLEYRGGRMALFQNYSAYDNAYPGTKSFEFVNMDDVINLKAGATYRLNSTVSLWLQAHNLLNRRYDILYGMGAQRIGFMAGASFTF
ncbi:MAG: TonB-dependent receptor [Muribaculaceae bacterium]|nr:TonB-dependent receptor [Muribaculaceae bacterium]